MTDITELTSVQKNANIHRLSRLIAYAPNDELRQMAVEVEHYTDQLIEALEKAQTKADVYDMLRDDYGLREKGVGLADFVDWQAKRIAEMDAELEREREKSRRVMTHIAELESRTVKLPKPISVLHRREFTGAHCAIYAYPEAEVNAALDDAGIKVEAE
ncbi:hypothetical protein V6164_09900 [Klebsiella pneumoniae]|uniref:hypothetical protein n=1 Tax=Klebsiella pneumoniae TaxID=573 RepID=UPI000676638F|nr:hypothetical protein [Klebsiella pneumoniae]HDI1827715.1 hypothetical protein [Klebsiella pneumoniae]HDU9750499.1 hypothetical protein [Klebsiella pneumoniae]HDU9825039.1 hypothetical protein [Klebsiella pneumoniae]HDU9884678.1 hypothetical protein [Klebsiella pneumoniae]HDU9896061.1 hypothetical protein [Klebsiella pneumoniae]